jgi:hypothetical protein
VRAELTKRLDVKQLGFRGRGDDRNTTLIGSIPEDIGTIQPMVGGMGGNGGRFMNNVLSLQLARERAWQPRGGASKRVGLPLWNSETTGLDERSTSNQRLLERLEAENAQLRSSVVELALQIQALREAARTLIA